MFDRATQAAHDLASAGFGDASSNAVQLGKALQDPSKGMAALAKSGITFTDAEKKKIRAMQKSGDLLGAQKIIMGAVETQVKGTAAASATSSDKMATQWGNVKEALGTALLPTFDKLAAKFAEVADWVQRNTGAVLAIVGAIAAFSAALIVANAVMKVYTTYQKISEIMTKRQAVAQRALNLSMLANPVFLIIAAIIALVVAFVLLWRKSEAFRNFFKGLWDGIKGAVSAVVDWFRTAIPAAWQWVKDSTVAVWNAIVGALKAAWQWIKDAASAAFDAIKAVVSGAWDGLKSAAVAAWNGIKSVISGVWAGIKLVITTYINTIKAIVTGVWNAIRTATSAVWNTIRNGIRLVWDGIKTIVSTAINAVKTTVNNVFSTIKSAVLGVWNTIRNGIRAAWDTIRGIFRSSPVQAAIDAFQRLRDRISGFMQSIKDTVRAAWDWVKGKLDAIADGMSRIPFVGNLFKDLGAVDGATITFLPGAEQVPTRRERSVTINVSGAVDQEGTARTLSAMLDNLDVRHSRPVTRAVAW
jgi:phage-related protein